MCCVQENEVKLCLIQEDKIVLLAPSITLSMIALVIIWSLFLLCHHFVVLGSKRKACISYICLCSFVAILKLVPFLAFFTLVIILLL